MIKHVVSFTVRSAEKNETLKVSSALTNLSKKDSSLRTRVDPKSGRLVVLGTSEDQLRLVREKLVSEFGVKADLGVLEVFCRESLRGCVREEAKFIREHEGRRQFAHCEIEVKPEPGNKELVFVDAAKDSAIAAYAKSVEEGIRRAAEYGPLGGYPVIGVTATLLAGSCESGSDLKAFEIAGGMALRAACVKAKPFILEPIMKCEVRASGKEAAEVVGMLKGRDARFPAVQDAASGQIQCLAAQANLLGFAEAARKISVQIAIKTELSHFQEAKRDAPGA